jgi:hypothetical protein
MASALGILGAFGRDEPFVREEALVRDEAFVSDEALMSDRGVPPALDASQLAAQLAAQELQNRFITENLRRVFLLI